jgi:hypothetical protein
MKINPMYTTQNGETVLAGETVTVETTQYAGPTRFAEFRKYDDVNDIVFVRFAFDRKMSALDPAQYRITYIGE